MATGLELTLLSPMVIIAKGMLLTYPGLLRAFVSGGGREIQCQKLRFVKMRALIKH